MDDHDHPTTIFGLSPLFMALICATGSAAALLAYHCIVSRRCTHHGPTIPRRQPPRRSATNLGADTLSSMETYIADLIPSCEYSKDIGMATKTQDKTCAVCLCEFMDGDPVRVLPECLHPFHVPCIDMWLYSHSNCPVCRTDATPSPLPLGHRPEFVGLELPSSRATRSGVTR